MPGRGKGKYVSRNFQRHDIGLVKAKINTHTNEVEELTLEIKAIDEIPKIPKPDADDGGASVDALIVKRKQSARNTKPVNKRKNTN